MSIPPFDSKTVSGYGLSGQETAQKMYDSLSQNGYALSYHPSFKIFTVSRDANIRMEDIQEIFNKNKYDGWAPEILGQITSNGKCLVRLTWILPPPEWSLLVDDSSFLLHLDGVFRASFFILALCDTVLKHVRSNRTFSY